MFTYRDYIYQVERHQDHIARAEQWRLAHSVEQTGLRSEGVRSEPRRWLADASNNGATSLSQRMATAMNGLRLDARSK